MELRDYQKQAIQDLRMSFKTGHRTPVLSLPTGSGKTVIAGEIIKMARERDKKVAFIVDRLALVDQASAHLTAIDIDHGIIQGAHEKTNYRKPVQVVSIQTLARRRPWPFDIGIIDEAHILFKAHRNIIETWNNLPFIGLSATPYSKGMGLVYDDLIRPISINELIEQGSLVESDIYAPSQPDMSGVKMSGGDFNQKQAGERTDDPKLIADIVETWLKLGEGKQTICFATNVLHSKHITEKFTQQGINAKHIDAYTDIDDRREVIKQFKRNEITILSSVGVLTTGFDAPNVEVEIIARPTKSLMLHCQMVGRAIRPHENKDRAIILDHAGNFERLGFHTDPMPDYLDMGDKNKSERKMKLPKPCPKCAYMKTTAKCPQCDHVAIFVGENTIHEEEGELMAISNNKTHTREQKQIFFAGLKGYAMKKGYAKGWISHTYKSKYGVWPNAYKDTPSSEPNQEVLNYVKYLNIKRHHDRKKENAHAQAQA